MAENNNHTVHNNHNNNNNHTSRNNMNPPIHSIKQEQQKSTTSLHFTSNNKRRQRQDEPSQDSFNNYRRPQAAPIRDNITVQYTYRDKVTERRLLHHHHKEEHQTQYYHSFSSSTSSSHRSYQYSQKISTNGSGIREKDRVWKPQKRKWVPCQSSLAHSFNKSDIGLNQPFFYRYLYNFLFHSQEIPKGFLYF